MHEHICFLQSNRQVADFLVHEATQLLLAPVLQSVLSGCLISSCSLFWLYTMHAKGQDSFMPKYILSIQSFHEKPNLISWSFTVQTLRLSTASLCLQPPMQHGRNSSKRRTGSAPHGGQHKPCWNGPPAQAARTLGHGAVQTIHHHGYMLRHRQRRRLLFHSLAGRAHFTSSISAQKTGFPLQLAGKIFTKTALTKPTFMVAL